MAMRDACTQPLATRGAPALARHVRRRPRLIDEDKLFGIEVELVIEPLFASLYDVRAVLLARMGGLFLNVRPQRSRNVHSVARLAFTPRSPAAAPKLADRQIRRRLDQPQQIIAVWIELRASRLSLLARLAFSRLSRPPHPDNRRCVADPKPRRRMARRQPANAASITRSRKSWL